MDGTVDPADEEEGDEVDIIEEDVFTGENDGDDDFVDEQDANTSDQDPSEPGSEDEQNTKEVDDLPFEDDEETRDSAAGGSMQSDGDRKKVHSRPPPPPPPGAAAKPGLPPPPPAPAPAPRSALSSSLLGSLQSAARESLRKVAPPPEPKVDDRAHLLRSIQLGSAQLKGAPSKAAAPFQKIAVQVRNQSLLSSVCCDV